MNFTNPFSLFLAVDGSFFGEKGYLILAGACAGTRASNIASGLICARHSEYALNHLGVLCLG